MAAITKSNLPADASLLRSQPSRPLILREAFNHSFFPLAIQSTIASYAFSHFFSNVEKLFSTSSEKPLLVNLDKQPGETYSEHKNRIRAVLLQRDARDLYSDAINADQMIFVINPRFKHLKEGFDYSKTCLDDALRKKIYSSIINCLLFTFVDSEMIAIQNKYHIQCILMNRRGKANTSLEQRLFKAAEYAIKPKNCTESIPVLSTLSPPDVPLLLCHFTTHKEINSQALAIWSNIVSRRDAEAWSYKDQSLLMTALGIKGKTANKLVSEMQRQAMKSGIFDSLEHSTDILALNKPDESPSEDFIKERYVTEFKLEEDGEPEHTRVLSKSMTKVPDISDWTRHDEIELVETALETGANPNLSDRNGLFPLWKCKDPHVARLLLKHRADVDLVDAFGNSAIHFAVKNGAFSVVKQLILHKQELLDQANNCGRTPLHVAMLTLKAARSSFEIAHFLLDQGARVTFSDRTEMTAYSMGKTCLEELKALAPTISEDNAKVRKETFSQMVQVQLVFDKLQSKFSEEMRPPATRAPTCFENLCSSISQCFFSCFPCCICSCSCRC